MSMLATLALSSASWAGVTRPAGACAVASAVARNPVGYLIPCHRVISGDGQLHNYRWGSARKKAIIGREAAALEVQV